MTSDNLIERFIEQYRREVDYYENVARTAARQVEDEMRASGVRGIVSSRAKDPRRLEEKCRARSPERNYTTLGDIYDDIVDLAGVRVALYFPGELPRMDALIKRTFEVHHVKSFPEESTDAKTGNRFSGYSAQHYRVSLLPASLPGSERRYADATVEIQVASVLMHAWAEVEHDLIYKGQDIDLSDDERALLDQLNGLVIAGEIALEGLQKAGIERVGREQRMFSNHYELAAYIVDAVPFDEGTSIAESALGKIDVLFELLQRLEMNSPDQIHTYVQAVHDSMEVRPIAEQVMDQIFGDREDAYAVYDELISGRREGVDDQDKQAIGSFMVEWIRLERLIRGLAGQEVIGRTISQRMFPQYLPEADHDEYRALRSVRNELVHGVSRPTADELAPYISYLRQLNARLEDRADRAEEW